MRDYRCEKCGHKVRALHDCDTDVTITISRATAEGWITEAHDTTDRKAVLVALACLRALEGER